MIEIPLTQGRVALVDDIDAAEVTAAGPWFASHDKRNWYARREVAGRSGWLHGFLTGWSPVDHVNGNGLDNRRANLRQATNQQNSQNRGLSSINTSGYKGVGFDRRRRKWRAYIHVDGRQRHLGYFTTAPEAAAAYDIAAIEHFGDYARTNAQLFAS